MTLGTPAKLDAATVIDLADHASRLSVGQWSVALLRQAFPKANLEALLALPIGARDRLVLEVRSRTLSGPLRSEPACVECGAAYELTLDPAAYGLAEETPWPDADFHPIDIENHEVQLRPVNLGDLLAVETVAQPDHAVRMIAARVLREDRSDLCLDALAEALEALDPAADVWLETACPECGATQSLAFDPVHFVAHELRQLSQRILQDVVDIARAFHWSERDILALPDHRRAYYVSQALA